MNWKLILQLSVFGLIMAFGTISLIPENFEIIFWIVIFVFCGVVCAKKGTGKYFLHGFVLSLINCVWIVAVHMIFCNTYMANHPGQSQMFANMPGSLTIHPRLAMLIMGPVFGVIFGLIQGLIFFYTIKNYKKATA